MKKLAVLFCILFLSSISFAGFIVDDFWCAFPDDPGQTFHEWDFSYDAGREDPYELTLAENLSTLGIDQVVMSGNTDEDPIYRTIKLVTNESTVAWTSYELTLSAGPVIFTGVPSSDLFSSAVISNGGLKITFSGGVVNPTDEVMLSFKILVPTTGAFSVCLTQNPIPEPATMGLLSLGALAFIRRRK